MRTTIMTFLLLISVSSASTIDWTRLEMEMDYLKSQKTDSDTLLKTPTKEPATESLTLRRKSIDEKDGIIDLDPLFDEVNLKQASPQKRTQEKDQVNKSKNLKRIDGSIPKDAFESLVD